VTVPDGAAIVDGDGRTLLPGLIDAHTHVRPLHALRQALAFGVTTELEMAGDPVEAWRIRERQRAGLDPDLADVRSAGDPVTAPGGHGTEYGRAVPTVSSPAELPSWVNARIAEGSDYIKIILDAGTPGYVEWPVISNATLRAAIAAAHARERLAIVHVTAENDAIAAVEAGADGLAHVPFAGIRGDRLPALLRERNAFVISTLAVFYAICDPHHGDALADDPRIARLLTVESEAELRRGFPLPGGARPDCSHGREAARQLVRAGVTVLVGTDATNPGTVHGASVHGELASLVAAGMSPIQALRAATSLPAERFHLEDRGVIAVGRRADLLLVDGDPTRDVTTTRAIAGVWKAGHRFDPDRYPGRQP
jgi:imidazolonepropionase-like amidohydrolase